MSAEARNARFIMKHPILCSVIAGLAFFVISAVVSRYVNVSSLLAPFVGTRGTFHATSCEYKQEIAYYTEMGTWLCKGSFQPSNGQAATAAEYYLPDGSKGTEHGSTIPKSEHTDPFQAGVFPVEVTQVFAGWPLVQEPVGPLVWWSYGFWFLSLLFILLLYFLCIKAPWGEYAKMVNNK